MVIDVPSSFLPLQEPSGNSYSLDSRKNYDAPYYFVRSIDGASPSPPSFIPTAPPQITPPMTTHRAQYVPLSSALKISWILHLKSPSAHFIGPTSHLTTTLHSQHGSSTPTIVPTALRSCLRHSHRIHSSPIAPKALPECTRLSHPNQSSPIIPTPLPWHPRLSNRVHGSPIALKALSSHLRLSHRTHSSHGSSIVPTALP